MILAQYLALQGATNLRKSIKRSVKADDSPFVSGQLCIVFQECSLRQDFGISFFLNVFLIFHQISGCKTKLDAVID